MNLCPSGRVACLVISGFWRSSPRRWADALRWGNIFITASRSGRTTAALPPRSPKTGSTPTIRGLKWARRIFAAGGNVFHDRALDALICNAYHQNLSLKAAGFRVLEARSQLGIDTGNLFPQTQQGVGSYTRTAVSQHTVQGLFTPTPFYSNWNFGFTMAWELDFWGQFRRIIESDNANLDASVELYDAALVTLLGDVATNYANMRTLEQRIVYARNNAEIQRETLTIVEARFKASTTSELDVDQARSTLYATEAAIPELEISLRQTINQLCIDMGIPPEDLRKWIGPAPIPVAPQEVVIGVPADLLRRRPDMSEPPRGKRPRNAP